MHVKTSARRKGLLNIGLKTERKFSNKKRQKKKEKISKLGKAYIKEKRIIFCRIIKKNEKKENTISERK